LFLLTGVDSTSSPLIGDVERVKKIFVCSSRLASFTDNLWNRAAESAVEELDMRLSNPVSTDIGLRSCPRRLLGEARVRGLSSFEPLEIRDIAASLKLDAVLVPEKSRRWFRLSSAWNEGSIARFFLGSLELAGLLLLDS